jgi:S1-C subfamily serine protease
MSVIQELQDVVAGAAEAVGPSVVGLGRGWGRGSGVVTAPGVVLTNAHVLRGEEVAVTFADGRTELGRVAGADPDLDLAAIAVDTGDAPAIAWDP